MLGCGPASPTGAAAAAAAVHEKKKKKTLAEVKSETVAGVGILVVICPP